MDLDEFTTWCNHEIKTPYAPYSWDTLKEIFSKWPDIVSQRLDIIKDKVNKLPYVNPYWVLVHALPYSYEESCVAGIHQYKQKKWSEIDNKILKDYKDKVKYPDFCDNDFKEYCKKVIKARKVKNV